MSVGTGVQFRTVSSDREYDRKKGTATTTEAAVHTVATGGAEIHVASILVTNRHATNAATFSITHRASGEGIAADTYDIISEESLNANTFVLIQSSHPEVPLAVLQAGDTLGILASANDSINYEIVSWTRRV